MGAAVSLHSHKAMSATKFSGSSFCLSKVRVKRNALGRNDFGCPLLLVSVAQKK
jgi:hypothetical protein